MAGAPDELQAWAWAQKVGPIEKLVLVALATGGEVEPEPGDVATRCGIGLAACRTSIALLDRLGLVDADGRPVGP